MEGRVPGGSKAVLAQQEPGFDDDDEEATLRSADDAGNTGSRPASQSLPRSYRMLQPTSSNGGLSPTARKVDSLPGSLVNRTRSSTPERKKRSTSKVLRSFGSFMQRVARQLQAAASSGTSSTRSRTPTRQGSEGYTAGETGAVGGEQKDETAGTGTVNSHPPGVIGIQNHGNTCFMNATIQCLANTEPLAQYLVSSRYQSDIRRSGGRVNSLRPGARGELTESFGTVVKAIWTRGMTSEISSEFRSMVSRHGAQYRGYMQHDAQEFLLWLLDRVHEDVNIATKKKYRANKSNVGRPDEVVAAEALANHTRCNNSFIYNLFQALYRSSLTCPSCHHHSNTFDPFLSLSLPIPHRECHIVNVVVVRRSEISSVIPRTVMMSFTAESDDSVFDLRRMIADATELTRDAMVLLRTNVAGFRDTLCDTQPVAELSDSDEIFAIEVPPPSVANDVATVTRDEATAVVVNIDTSSSLRFGPLLVVRLCKQTALAAVRSAVYGALSCYFPHEFAPSLEDLLSLRRDDCSTSADDEFLLRDSALTSVSPGRHGNIIKLIAEWQKPVVDSYEAHVTDSMEVHESVNEAKSAVHQPSYCTLDDCFQLYTREERLGADDAWLCPHCRAYQQDTVKALSLWSFPEILIIQLKRFKQDTTQHIKLNTLVTFPVTCLDISRQSRRQNVGTTSAQQRDAVATSKFSGSYWLTWKPGRKAPESADDHIYDLYAVCNHYGNMQGGHYTAFCKNIATGRWYSFNDSQATEMREEEVVTRAAYLLFYQRRSAANDTSRSCDWLQQLQMSTNSSLSRTVTSHSLENILDTDKVGAAGMTDSVVTDACCELTTDSRSLPTTQPPTDESEKRPAADFPGNSHNGGSADATTKANNSCVSPASAELVNGFHDNSCHGNNDNIVASDHTQLSSNVTTKTCGNPGGAISQHQHVGISHTATTQQSNDT